jgi:formyl-CoA transferase
MTGKAPRRLGDRTETTAPRNVYQTKDGLWVALAGSTQSTALRLFKTIGKPELGEDPRFSTNKNRLANMKALDEIIGGWMCEYTRDEIVELLRTNAVPVGPIYDIVDLMNDIHVRARQMIVDAPDNDRASLPMEGVFPKMAMTPGTVRHAGNSLGADNHEIYLDRLGLSAKELEELTRAGIL